ncbi:diguanylate cyclase [Pseudomonas japonica]|uniref:diguanylate cyclase n=1 Tax=Pseudomonas japonica TaxID=256466 RepID=UPI0015E47322|nr:diguanylate cyclase [Pseudomonas japonica]MBA1245593.1 diguanylate cyclase [Pseudomonas japonica]
MSPIEPASEHPMRLHFAQRVVHQARDVLQFWQRSQYQLWTRQVQVQLDDAVLRWQRFAERYEHGPHLSLAIEARDALATVTLDGGRLDSPSLGRINEIMQRLATTGLRTLDDPAAMAELPPARHPVALMLKDAEASQRLARQLEFFGCTAQALDSIAALHSSLREYPPAAILLDVDFKGTGSGLELASMLQADAYPSIPLVFHSPLAADTRTRLAAVKAGGRAFISGPLEAWNVLETLEPLLNEGPWQPFRVLIIDDSRAQVMHTERMLKNVGMVTRCLTDPLDTMAALADFQPDLIILDMYMPGCTGTELAQAIRQNERYVSVPIIYLSAEGDTDKQLDAMSEAGDDFLTKPIRSRQLVTVVRNRAGRARSLRARMVRDSLTGLYNHTHILSELEDSCARAEREGRPLTFAMLDLDHFKRINDCYGHPMGDRVIKSLSLFLKQRLRASDLIGRYGGEEFAIVMPGTTGQAALGVLEDIRQRFAAIQYPAQPQDIRCTFSAGLATLQAGMRGHSLASRADAALYQAKQQGRNRVVAYTASGIY